PINLARRFILVGDHRQLPPIVVSDQSLTSSLDTSLLFDDPPDEPENQPQLDLFGMPIEENTGSRAPRLSEDLREMGCAGLDRSLFERLIEFSPHLMLDIQYRMHEDIMAFSSEEFYGGRLLAHESNRRWGLDGLGELLGHESAVVFVDVDVESGGRTNEDEARAIIAALEALGSQLDSTSVGVVTPFRAQAHLIRHMLKNSADLASRDIDVDTVERFQGSERDVIMVSLVKTERAGEFLADPRRLNVTLTRARKKLMIFGNRSCLELNPLFRRLLEQRQTTFISWTKPQL
ncbi:MAG: DEAD/DEAH box helicase family protein, partial [Bradymonadaceae bacterium]